MFLTPAERGHRAARPLAGPEPGARVVYGSGVVHWFPGGSAGLARILLQASVPPELLADPDTRIEFGDRTGSAFVCREVIKEGRAPSGSNPG